MELDKYDPEKHSLEEYLEDLRIEDKWILSRINSLVNEVTEALNKYRIHEAARMLRRFIVEDISHWYIRLIRPVYGLKKILVTSLQHILFSTTYYINGCY